MECSVCRSVIELYDVAFARIHASFCSGITVVAAVPVSPPPPVIELKTVPISKKRAYRQTQITLGEPLNNKIVKPTRVESLLTISPSGSPPQSPLSTTRIVDQPVQINNESEKESDDDDAEEEDESSSSSSEPTKQSAPTTFSRKDTASLSKKLAPICTVSASEFFGMRKGFEPYNIIYADPPWTYEVSEGRFGCVWNHYGTMTTADIWKMPVHELAAKNCALLLWATAPKIIDAITTMRYWGFDYKTIHHVWVKTTKEGAPIRNGIGSYARPCAEYLLVGIKGKLKFLKNKEKATRIQQLLMRPRRGHSRKPVEVREMIEQFFLPELRKIELFAREKSPGWDLWGNEVEKFQQ